MKLNEYCLEIEKFLQEYLVTSHTKGYVLGLSGGVDSSLCALLTANAVGKEKLTCILIPIESQKADIEDASKLCKDHDLKYIVISGDQIYKDYLMSFLNQGVVFDKTVTANLKARIRMSILYAYAQKHNNIVLGTDNADERYTGYFTKYGDGGVDILPLAHLVKHEVVEAAKLYGLESRLAERIPSAGLFEGQTDEGEMGIKYKDIDAYLVGKKVDPEVVKKIEHLHKISEHKRVAIPTPKEFKRD